MSETVSGCIQHKDTRYIQVRCDYLDLYQGNEHKAKIVRVLETWTDFKRTEWYKNNLDRIEQGQEIEEPDFWITMSYKQFRQFMFGTSSIDTIKTCLDELVKAKHIERRISPDNPYGSPQYLLNYRAIQKGLNKLGTPSFVPELPPQEEVTPPGKPTPPPGVQTTPTQGGELPLPQGGKSVTSNNNPKNTTKNTTKNKSVCDVSPTESTPPRDTHTSFENSSREGEQDGNLHSHRNDGVNEYSNQSVRHTLRPAPDTHGAPSDERKEQVPLAEPTTQAHSVDTAMSTAPRTPASPLLSPSSGVRGVSLQDHNRVGSPPADDKSQTNKPVLSKQELALRRKWAKYVSEDVTRETVIIALGLRSAWLEAYGAYGDAEWDNQAILWLAQQDNGTFANVQKVYRLWEDKEPSKPIHPEMIKNKWFWLNEKKSATPDKPATTTTTSSISHVSQEISDRNLARLHARIAAKHAAAAEKEG